MYALKMVEQLTISKTYKQPHYKMWFVIGVFIALIASSIAYNLNVFDHSQSSMQATLDESCDLHKGSCKSVFADGSSVSLLISPNTIPLLQRLQLRVEVQGISAKKVEIDFTGYEIDLGYNRPELKALNKTTFIGDAFLPLCTLSEMDWSAKVLLHTDKGLMMAPYKFHTVKKSTVYDLY